ncbi:MAG: phosphatidylserine/phosphatidylglycerophosphate/cardiolipin synthase family protein [Bdellovibrionales bacterium]|nr:phosphatidylserine/phosphatidylglycerophosphate/cardiolipin synthase family protein [Bdellovibrionales bacterium]
MALLFTCLLGLSALITPVHAKVYEYTDNNKLSLLESPEAAVNYKIELIKKAKHHVHILTFFWDESGVPKRMAEALNEAHARGVEVRILTTSVATLTTDLLGKGKRALNTKSKEGTFSFLALSPKGSFSLTHNLHEKVFIVDGEKAIIGGRNISDSSLNGKDMEVEMNGPVVNQVQDHFKRMFDFVTNQRIDLKCYFEGELDNSCAGKLKKDQFSDSDALFFPIQPTYVDGVKARILSHEAILHMAEDKMNKKERLLQKDDILDTVVKIDFKKLRMYNYFLVPTKRYQEFLESNLAKGNSIEIITNSIETGKFSSNMGYIYSLPNSLNLVNRGLGIYQWQTGQRLTYVHEKVFVFDEDHVIIGSHNLVTGSTAVSNEISVEFFSRPLATRLLEIFDGEKNDPKITNKVSAEQLEREVEENKKKIKFLQKDFIGSFLREIY